MKPELSIIMPCYNCAATLEEAVASIYTQNLGIPFEIVMVDDGSNDNTRQLIIELVEKYKEIKYFFHEKNRGGGAARNTAVSQSGGEIIFCLDSDDILPENILPKLILTMKNFDCDGVVFERSMFFKTNPKECAASVANFKKLSEKKNDRIICLTDLFKSDDGFLTQVNFLYKKEFFHQVGGYPVNHGFDTQGYGFRFLAAGGRVFICSGSYYYHRQAYKNKSYFERVYENGEFSRNIYLILEEILYQFSSGVASDIIKYSIFDHNRLGGNNLKSFLDRRLVELGDSLFIEKKWSSFTDFYKARKSSADLSDVFLCAVYEFKNKLYQLSLVRFQDLEKNLKTQVISYNILRCSIALAGEYELAEIDKEAFRLSKLLFGKGDIIKSRPSLFNIIKSRLLKLLK